MEPHSERRLWLCNPTLLNIEVELTLCRFQADSKPTPFLFGSQAATKPIPNRSTTGAIPIAKLPQTDFKPNPTPVLTSQSKWIPNQTQTEAKPIAIANWPHTDADPILNLPITNRARYIQTDAKVILDQQQTSP